jgi:hypothetical protein
MGQDSYDNDYDYKQELARELLSSGITAVDLELEPDPALFPPEQQLAALKGIPYPDQLGPVPQEIVPTPSPSAKLPTADILVVTWTIDEQRALADVMTPGFSKDRWYRYNRKFAEYEPKIRRGAPAKNARRLGSYFLTKIGKRSVLCFKSELHLNQDGIDDPANPGNATLPVKDLFHQLMDEVQPKVVLTVGTSGGVSPEHDLGDVVVTRGAKFRVQKEFRNAPFNQGAMKDHVYKSVWDISEPYLAQAQTLMAKYTDMVKEPDLMAPTARYELAKGIPAAPGNTPDIKLDGRDMKPFHPILTTDYFEFGTTTNKLFEEGCAVEMGDAVLGLACEERAAAKKDVPLWAVVRNLSDPCINGELPNKPSRTSLQAMWAVYYYKGYGYWTSVMSALTTWGIIAGTPDKLFK